MLNHNDAPVSVELEKDEPLPRRGRTRKPKPEPKPRKARVAKPVVIFVTNEVGQLIQLHPVMDITTEYGARRWIKTHATDGQAGRYRILRELANVAAKVETVTRVTLE